MSRDNVKCENHPEVGYDAAFQIADGRMMFLCEPCAVEYRKTNATQYKGRREAWEQDLNAERDYQRRTYGISDWDFGKTETVRWK